MNLNAGQQAMANHHNGPLLAIAVAGAGKTTAVVENLRNKYRMGIDLQNVMVTAFNKDAAEQLKKRVGMFYGLVDSCPIGTSHSLFYKILRDCGLRIKDLYKEWEAQEALRSVLWPRYQNNEEASVFRAISMMKNCLAYPEDIPGTNCFETYEAMRPGVAEGCEVDEVDFERAFLAYEADKNSKQSIDMDDMLFKCFVLFTQRPDALEVYQGKFQHLVVDEYQDTNEVQYQLFKMLSSQHRNIIAVGDDDQAIYGFRGSYPKYIRRFQNDFPESKMVTMDANYRSQSSIINLANNVIVQNTDRFKKVLQPTVPEISKPYYVALQDQEHEAEWIADCIKNTHLSFKNVAILTRVNMQQALIEQHLSMQRIPYNVADSTSFFSRKEIMTTLGYLKIAAYGIEPNMYYVKELANKPYRKLSADLINGWQDFGDFVQFCNHDARGINYYEQLEYIEMLGQKAEIADVLDAIINKPIHLGRWANRNAGIGADTKPTQIMAHLAKIGGTKSVHDMIVVIEGIQKFYKEMHRQKDRVTLCTIHRAKGLEWEEVYVPGCNGELIPHKNNFDTEEERRLFYVAITRAKAHLILTTHKNEPPSPFVESVLEYVDADEIEREVQMA